VNLDAKAARIIKQLDPSIANIVKGNGKEGLAATLMALEFLAQKCAHDLRENGVSEEDCIHLARRGVTAFTALVSQRNGTKALIKVVGG